MSYVLDQARLGIEPISWLLRSFRECGMFRMQGARRRTRTLECGPYRNVAISTRKPLRLNITPELTGIRVALHPLLVQGVFNGVERSRLPPTLTATYHVCVA